MYILDRLAKSKFRSRFKLRAKELEYIKDKGLDTIHSHACDFIRDRVAPAEPANDGKQTPMRGHPVFIAQHATATCCRTCLNRWWRVRKGIALTAEQQKKITNLMMAWIEMQVNGGIESVKKKMSDHGHWGVGSASLPLPPTTSHL